MKLLVSHWRRAATAGTEGQLRPELDRLTDGRQVHVRGHGWVTGGSRVDTPRTAARRLSVNRLR